MRDRSRISKDLFKLFPSPNEPAPPCAHSPAAAPPSTFALEPFRPSGHRAGQVQPPPHFSSSLPCLTHCTILGREKVGTADPRWPTQINTANCQLRSGSRLNSLSRMDKLASSVERHNPVAERDTALSLLPKRSR
jgi:hypothetical protein